MAFYTSRSDNLVTSALRDNSPNIPKLSMNVRAGFEGKS
jgi:hypothetical protein